VVLDLSRILRYRVGRAIVLMAVVLAVRLVKLLEDVRGRKVNGKQISRTGQEKGH
jgi:hypothetical protein